METINIPPSSSDEMKEAGIVIDTRPFIDPYAITCNKGTLYPETCKFMDCKYATYNANAPHGCAGCQHKAEESDIGI